MAQHPFASFMVWFLTWGDLGKRTPIHSFIRGGITLLAFFFLFILLFGGCSKEPQQTPTSTPDMTTAVEYSYQPQDLSQLLEHQDAARNWHQAGDNLKKGGKGKGNGNGNGQGNQGGGGSTLPEMPEDIVPDVVSDWNIQWDTTVCGYVKVTFDAQPNFNGYKPWVSPPETCATEQDTIMGEPYSSNFYNATSNVMYFYPGIYCLSANKWKKLVIYAFELDTVNNAWIIHQSLPDSIFTGQIVSFCN